jgi:uncharacterized protein YjbI with pentapeptide repeats
MNERPANTDPDAWQKYWEAQGQPWRTEPEIDAARQDYLTERYNNQQEPVYSAHPFAGIKLDRADMEWLLAQYHAGDWSDATWADRYHVKHKGLDFSGVIVSYSNLSGLPLQHTSFAHAQMHHTRLEDAQLEGSYLRDAELERAMLIRAHLEKVNLRWAHLQGANLDYAYLAGANLGRAVLDATTLMHGIHLSDKLHGAAFLADVRWADANLGVLNWTSIVGDESVARQKHRDDGTIKDSKTQRDDARRAVRTYRQLATVLRSQGMNEEADRFAYRARFCQRTVLRQQRHIITYVGSVFLDLLAGYGYRPERTLLAYLLVVLGFALSFFFLAPHSDLTLSPLASLVMSVSSFHGRGFFPGANIPLDAPLTVFAAAEAIIGLVIEVSFIATFTQRFFAR